MKKMDHSLDLSQIPETLFAHRNRARFILNEVNQHQTMLGRKVEVLDVGCGTGNMISVWVARIGATVLGIDIHQPSIDLANSRHSLSNLRFRVATAEDILVERHKYDVIICSEVLEHLYEPLDLLIVLRKLIRPDGIVIMTVPNGWGPKEFEESILSIFHKVKSSFHRVFMQRHTGDGQPVSSTNRIEMLDTLNAECGHVNFFTKTMIKRLTERAGFQIQKHENRRFLSGTISNRVVGNNQGFIEWNVRIAGRIPHWLASSWMFVLKPISQKGI